MESKGTFFILIIVVAILTFTLAALAGYLFLVQGAPQPKSDTAAAATQKQTAPKQEDLAITPLFEGKRYFNLKNDDPKKIAIIQVNVSLEHLIQIKGEKKTVEEDLTFYSPKIQELVVKFFLNMTIDDIKNPSVMDKAGADLKKQINKLLNEGKKEPHDVITDVIFSEWLFQ